MIPVPPSQKFLMLVSLAAIFVGCHRHRETAAPESYVENGVPWAYGSVQLTDIDAPGSVMLKRLPPEQIVDGHRFRFFAAVNAQTHIAAAERDLAYVDFHPGQERLLAYNYQLEFVERSQGQQNIVDIFGILRKGGRSYFGRQRVYLGNAVFGGAAEHANVNLADGLSLSLIGNGVYAGQWALHYPKVPHVVPIPWQAQCPKTVTQAPGQNPSQNPGQFLSCKPLPPAVDLCGGKPAKFGCYPKPPPPGKWQVLSPGTPQTGHPAAEMSAPPPPAPPLSALSIKRAVTDLEPMGDKANVYFMAADTQEAKISFVHDKIEVLDDSTNAASCARLFFAVARTIDSQENVSCFIKPAPTAIEGGKLTCGVQIRFDRAETYLEKVCNITAVFREKGGSKETVQILKR